MAEESQPADNAENSSQHQESQSILEKAKQFLTLGGDKKKITKAAIAAIAVILIFGLLSVGIWGVAIAFWIKSFGEPNGNGSTKSGACYLKDEAFTNFDESTVGNTDWVLNALSKYNIRRDKANEVIKTALNQDVGGGKVNPALMMAIWSGEASFEAKNDEAAFGCTVYDHNGDGRTDNSFPTFSGQTKCAKTPILQAMSSTAPYNQPSGENIFTRLFWNYTGAMKAVYQSKGYVADANNPRIVILKLLVPNDVVCVEEDGGNLTPVDINNLASWYFNQGPDTSRGGGDWGNRQGTSAQCGGWPNGKIYRASGCAITSSAMIARYYDKNINPFQMGNEFCSKSGTLAFNANILGRIIGKTPVHKANPSLSDIKSFVRRGPVIAQGNPCFDSTGGHFVVIAGDDGSNFIINDPSNSSRGKAGRIAPYETRGNISNIWYFK